MLLELVFENSNIFYKTLYVLKNKGYTFGSGREINPERLKPLAEKTKETIVLYKDKTIRLSCVDYHGTHYTIPQIFVKSEERFEDEYGRASYHF